MARASSAAQKIEDEGLDVSRPEDDGERARLEADALRYFSDLRAELLIRATLTFWAHAGLNLEPRIEWGIPTAATDGRSLFINPKFWNAQDEDKRMGLFAHEIQHCVMRHCARGVGMVPWKGQLAADCAVNDILRDHFTLPDDGIYPETFGLERGLSFEEYYALIPDTPKNRMMGGGIEALSTGMCIPTPQDGQFRGSEADWATIADGALAAARMRGNVPAGIERMIGSLHARVNWQAVLQEFLTPRPDDYAWTNPNRRHVWYGNYLPGKGESTEMGKIVVMIDASGSMTDEDLSIAASEIEAATLLNPRVVEVISHETDAKHVMTWTPEDGPFTLAKVDGGGGTSHLHAFKLVEEMEDQPEAVIAFTDLMSEFPKEPSMRVLWVHRGAKPSCAPPWGAFVSIPV